MSKVIQAGIVTAYGAAVRGGYTGTYDKFCSDLAELADVLSEFLGFSVTIETLNEGTQATASYNDGVLALGIPRGNTGNGIQRIERISTQGLVKTYRITYTNGTYFDFQVSDGNGIDHTTLNADYTLTITYTDGTTWTSGPIRGATGATPNLTIGTVETLLPTQSATATITGTAEDPVLNLGIPKGDTGEVSQAEFDDLSGTVSNLNRQLSELDSEIDDINIILDSHTSSDTRQPTGNLVISTALVTNATYDNETKTLTIPADKICAGASIRYRYTAVQDDLGRTIRFILDFAADLHDNTYITPIVYWNYVNVTNESYVSITQETNSRWIYDITIPNERKNLDVGIIYKYGGTVSRDQTIKFNNLEYFYYPKGKTYYTFNSNFLNAKMTSFGDSYTAQGKWQPFIKARLGLVSYSGFSQGGGTLTSIYEEIDTLDVTADIVTVWIGTNDYGNNRKIGTLLDDVTDDSIKDAWGYTTFCAALNYICNWLSNNMKGKCVVFITPTQRYDSIVDTFRTNNGVNNKDEVINNAGFALEDYANAMIDVANYWGYPVCDMYHESGINKNSYTAFYQSDKLHPSDTGADLLAQKIATFINSQI